MIPFMKEINTIYGKEITTMNDARKRLTFICDMWEEGLFPHVPRDLYEKMAQLAWDMYQWDIKNGGGY